MIGSQFRKLGNVRMQASSPLLLLNLSDFNILTVRLGVQVRPREELSASGVCGTARPPRRHQGPVHVFVLREENLRYGATVSSITKAVH